jgi:succinate dehydrogenase / fumarate reductase iron-sulfur subunit
MAQITFHIQRFNPDAGDKETHFQDYVLTDEDLPLNESTVLDALNHIKWYKDDTLAHRMSCRSAICGSCSMRVNGHTKLVCQTQVSSVVRDGVVTIQPMRNMSIVKDLVVDMQPFWSRMEAVEPYLQPSDSDPEKERLQDPAVFKQYEFEATCIMCACCVSDCTVLEVDDAFLAPAALAKAKRFVYDDRDGKKQERLQKLSGHGGMWDCVRCNECVQSCPKEVRPMDAIVKLREAALREGIGADTVGAKHVKFFTESVVKTGVLDERELPMKAMGIGWALANMGTALPAMFKGKIKPPPFGRHKVEKVEDVQRIAQALEAKK